VAQLHEDGDDDDDEEEEEEKIHRHSKICNFHDFAV
jgi:hypothetical protein